MITESNGSRNEKRTLNKRQSVLDRRVERDRKITCTRTRGIAKDFKSNHQEARALLLADVENEFTC